jgi:guanylate kinase
MNHVYILSGPGGCGKDSIIKALVADQSLNLVRGVSATSRPKRIGEIEGVNRYFYSKDKFKKAISDGNILEYEIMDSNGEFYGTPKQETNDLLDNHNIIFDKMAFGAMVLKDYFKENATTIFIDATDAELKRRLSEASRVGESDNVQRRLEQGEKEREYKPRFDHRLENHDGELNSVVDQIKQIIINK